MLKAFYVIGGEIVIFGGGKVIDSLGIVNSSWLWPAVVLAGFALVIGTFVHDRLKRKRQGQEEERSALEDDFRLAPGSGKIAAQLILQQDDLAEAERTLNKFEVQAKRTDEAYPFAAFATKLAERDETTDADHALRRLPESAQWQVDEAIEWALCELTGESHETDS